MTQMLTSKYKFKCYSTITINYCFFFLFLDTDLDELELQVVRYKPEGLDNLCRNTKFSRKELQIMYRGFKQVKIAIMYYKYKVP